MQLDQTRRVRIREQCPPDLVQQCGEMGAAGLHQQPPTTEDTACCNLMAIFASSSEAACLTTANLNNHVRLLPLTEGAVTESISLQLFQNGAR